MSDENRKNWNVKFIYSRSPKTRFVDSLYLETLLKPSSQFTLFRISFRENEIRPRYLRVAEVAVSTLSRNVLPSNKETTSGFRREQTVQEELVQADQRAQLAEV